MTTHQSNDKPVSDILKAIENGTNKLPDFQRGWVWDDSRICALIASISNSYPVGALMFMEYGGDSTRFKHRVFEGAPKSAESTTPEVLVLDGQQRLTSVFGTMFCKDAVITRDSKGKEIKRVYYLNILKCLQPDIDRLDAIESLPEDKRKTEDFGRQIILDVSTREKEFDEHLFPLNIVYDHIASGSWMDEYRAYHHYNKDILEQLRKFNAQILVPIQTYKVPVITLNKDTPKEAVCQVFENVNTGGVSLTVFELVTAMFAAEDFDLREDWYGNDKKGIRGRFGRKKMKEEVRELLSVVSDVDFLVAITLLSRYNLKKTGGNSAPAVSCKKQDVLSLTRSVYDQYADELTEGFIQAANFLIEQRIFSNRDLPYTSQLIPLSVLFAVLKKRAEDITIREKLAQWYWCGVLGEMYGAANETRYANDVTGVTDWLDGKGEPDTIQRAFFQPTRLLSLQTRNSAAYKGIVALILKAKAIDFISGKEMDFTVFSDENIDIHHIFPRAYCEDEKILKTKWNSIINKTPLSYRTNRIIGGKAPSIYMKKIEKDGHVTEIDVNQFVATHLVDVDHFRADRFNEYFFCRAKALLELISKAMGKPVTGLGGDDVIKEFGSSLE